MYADSVRDSEYITAACSKVAVKVLDESDAVTAEDEAVSTHANAVFTYIEGILAGLLRAGVTVGHHLLVISYKQALW